MPLSAQDPIPFGPEVTRRGADAADAIGGQAAIVFRCAACWERVATGGAVASGGTEDEISSADRHHLGRTRLSAAHRWSSHA
jgi:hypothetical protein